MLTQAFALSAFAIAAMAQSATATRSGMVTAAPSSAEAETTITALFGNMTEGFAGSVIAADPCDTTLALQCTDTSQPLCAAAANVTFTVTFGPTAYEAVYATQTFGLDASIVESCDLEGPPSSFTRAVCTASISASIDGAETATATVETLTDPADFVYATIPITAGASNLPPAGATCSAAASSESGGSSGSGWKSGQSDENLAATYGVREIYKILVPVGAAIAGALI